ncbi:response regulator transcription factor [Leucobacter chromiireducens]|uniref:DNA-binding response regulator n=1 Tax=Leucobacter chromiireducens subsp. chromiireducens TaxID=660067 RepID=A0ABS1SQH6_9MICO|nr:response regulator transcription factor [Leucobacter chromiireducens]MBL3690432.1 DNA-binding response regulator [Leucobacter chromiireducens subsp. chromiireducens]
MRVLIVEDEAYLAEATQTVLRRSSIAADIVLDGHAAIEQLAHTEYDVVLLDRDLPGMHGDEVCAWIVANVPGTRVLMLTAAGLLDEKVEGFALGADDYLVKPFDFPELLVRLQALHRRNAPPLPPVLEAHGVRLDPFRREVFRDGRYVHVSRKEFALLRTLLEAGGGVLSAEQLLERAWDENADPFTNAIRVTMSTLRKRLGEPRIIQTVPGVGYRIVGPEPALGPAAGAGDA